MTKEVVLMVNTFKMLEKKLLSTPTNRWSVMFDSAQTVIEFEIECAESDEERCFMSIEYQILSRFRSCDFSDPGVEKSVREVVSVIADINFSLEAVEKTIMPWFRTTVDKTIVYGLIYRFNGIRNAVSKK